MAQIGEIARGSNILNEIQIIFKCYYFGYAVITATKTLMCNIYE